MHPQTQSWWIDADTRGRRVQLFAGDRRAPEKQPLPDGREVDLPGLGRALLCGLPEPAADALCVLRDASTFLVEVCSWVPDRAFTAAVLRAVLADGDLADEIADRAGDPFQHQRSHTGPAPGDRLATSGVERLDFVVASVAGSGGAWCYGTRGVHAFVHPDWVALIWGAILPKDDPRGTPAPHWDLDVARSSRSVLAVREARRFPVTVEGNGGPSRLARYLQHVMQHHAYNLETVGNGVESLEADFYERSEGVRAVADLSAALASLGRALVTVRHADKLLARRAEIHPAFPDAVEGHATRHARAQAERGLIHRDGLRAAYGLISAAMAQEQALVAEAEARRMETLQHYAGYVAAIVLIPGLVAAVYGADVTGLPGQHTAWGLAVMLFLAAVGAVGTIVILRRATAPG